MTVSVRRCLRRSPCACSSSGIDREDEYYERLRGEASRIVETELRNLLNLVTVTETCFFRDASQFRLLREHIIPTLVAERSRASSRPVERS